jgi:ABC-type transporter lipoprotein component MlaA
MTTTMQPRSWRRGLTAAAAGLCLALTSACATDPFGDPRDPFEEVNRATFSFNELLDRALFTPLAQGYNAITPAPVNRGVTNFFNNLGDIGSAANNLLQFKVGRAVSDLGRVAVNSTLGILGVVDVASNLNLPRYNEDFGQTLGVWGLEPGPYLVLPIIGPSTVRDASGFAVDFLFDPSPTSNRRDTAGTSGACRSSTPAPTCSAPVGSWARPRSIPIPSFATPSCSAASISFTTVIHPSDPRAWRVSARYRGPIMGQRYRGARCVKKI